MDEIGRTEGADLDVNQLAFEATRWLRRSGVTAEDGRVAAEVDVRTVRYYASLGLVDRPIRYAERRAFYGRRHLLQIVAVKRLQAAGSGLADIQRRLVGATDEELATVAGGGAPPTLPAAPHAALRAEPAPPFWPRRARLSREPAAPRASVVRQTRVELAPGLALVVDLDQWPDASEPTAAMRLAATALSFHTEPRSPDDHARW